MSDVIYENPRAPLPEWARYIACDQHNTFWFSIRPRIVSQRNPDRARWAPHDGEVNTKDYLIDGPWWETTRRLIRLSDPAYYVPENPHTDDEGFLRHEGGNIPGYVVGRFVLVKLKEFPDDPRPGPAQGYRWDHVDDTSDIIAYRIVETLPALGLPERVRLAKKLADECDRRCTCDDAQELEKRITNLERRLESLERSTGQAVLDSMRF